MIIKTVNLTKIYRRGSMAIKAVDNVNLNVKKGSFVSIVGPSGAGKTTLLNLIGLIDKPTSGRIFFNEVDTSLLSERERRKIRLLKIGFIFQTFNLLPQLTALENVELPMALMGASSHKQRERAMKLLEAVGLRDKWNSLPRWLSVGEMRRVTIARALANEPQLILADEPTGDLDSKTGSKIIDLLHSLHREKKTTFIIATHDEKVARVSEKVYMMHNGRLEDVIQ